MPRTAVRGLASGLLLVPLTASLGAAQTPAGDPAGAFVERIEVTAIELMVDVRDRQGRPVRGLGVADFQVFEDGVPMEVIAVEDPPARSPYAPEPEPGAAAEAAAWRFLIYFDLPLTQKRSVRQAAAILAGRAEELVALGPVELVVANPQPEIVLPFSRDAKRLRQELDGVARLPARHLIAGIRREFLGMLDARLNLASPGASDTAAVRNRIRSSVNREFLILNRRLITLGQWIGAYGHVPASAAILVTDGFDMAPADFYLNATSQPGAEAELSLELTRFRVDPLAEGLAREMAARGWTGVVMALGGVSELAAADASLAYRDRFRSIGEIDDLSAGPGSGSPVALLEHPHEPLTLVSQKTGGELATARGVAGRALDRVGERVRLTYLAPRAKDGMVRRVDVRSRDPRLVVQAPGWARSPTREQIAAARARRLLLLSSEAGELPVRVAVGELAAATRDTRRATVEIFFDLNAVRPVLPRPSVPMTFTFGVEIPEAPPLVYEVRQDVVLPADESLAPWPDFLYRVVLDLPVKARRLSLVVEEPGSGIWGGAARSLDPAGGGRTGS